MPTKKSTTKTSVIRTEYGERLRLTPTRLIQIDHTNSTRPWFVTKAALKHAVQTQSYYIPIHQVRSGDDDPFCLTVKFVAQSTFNSDPQIGCCYFEAKTFSRILRHFGIRKSRSKARA